MVEGANLRSLRAEWLQTINVEDFIENLLPRAPELGGEESSRKPSDGSRLAAGSSIRAGDLM